MCGIAGLISRRGDVVDVDHIVKMSELLAHRGPDGNGYLVVSTMSTVFHNRTPAVSGDSPRVALAHRRLSVIDPTDSALQPMSYDGRYYIVFNGEIYNYKELRAELAQLGHQFRTSSDTEVLLAAFSQWGCGCFQRFNGMWALAIYDSRTSLITLSRDRLGVKPLYVRLTERLFAFASEIKSLKALGGLSASPGVVEGYLRLGIVGLDNRTFFNEVEQFPAGCYAQIQVGSVAYEPVHFWTPQISLQREHVETGCLVDELRQIFVDSVKLRLRSDVPVGFCLSGGLDSSSIVGAARHLLGAQASLSTFHSRSDVQRFDESSWASMVVRHVNATAYDVIPQVGGLLEDIDQLIWHQDEPFSSLSIYAQWALMRKARQERIPVLLDGQGSDELFAGYRKYLFAYAKSLLRARQIGRLSASAFGFMVHGDRGAFRLKDGFKYMPSLIQQRAFGISRFMRLNGRGETDRVGLKPVSIPSDVREMSLVDLTSTSLPSLLRYEDRNSMAWAIEAREPFLDYRLVDFALTLPDHVKIAHGQLKYILREAMRPYLPKAVIERRDKFGFATADVDWVDGGLRRWIVETLAESRLDLNEWVDVDGILEILRSRKELPVNFKREILRLFIATRWRRKFDV